MTTPRHIGIIMDGNRRYAKSKGFAPHKGHEHGKDKLEEVLEWCEKADVKELTLYTLSKQNLERSPQEVSQLLQMLKKNLKDLLSRSEELSKRGVCIRVIGDWQDLENGIPSLIKQVHDITQGNAQYIVNLAIAYGGRAEITHAARLVAQKVLSGELKADQINEKTLTEHMHLQSCPDLIIRTGGNHRTSNFLPWQSYYSEWFFVDALWPDFSKEEFDAILEKFSTIERRFGH